MSDLPNPGRRKTRTRQHVIADLGVNHVERQILLAGFTAERFRFDYGLDLEMKTFGPGGESEGGHVSLQVKATERLQAHADGSTIPFRVDVADLKAWVMEWVPVVLVVYEAAEDRAFWLDVQDYARGHELDEEPGGVTVTLHLPTARPFNPAAVMAIRDIKLRSAPHRP